ncbi:hypothetical protein DYB37_008056 [Aphanomyces astaci]|uniref:Uncharacterized protein n=1 Tax=Aphanomyces astaci TaxID=112090 RepID=A0A397EE34_APHAT|nr:hypothetical protein DYB25_006559 [Aphanomyces astaci]RHY35839.1 hypothetical protein DYB38_004944 [Aphanomyces astaci]RHY81768.1 hypothetical protein DYB31_006941 [Aphanomyces astaci]RHY98025.1 hypothetical protein DYB35_002585 [Aphanomyces astaci]RHZ28056.1 hypothetical protein DYB37_008056 [Aphanomyces astaci]
MVRFKNRYVIVDMTSMRKLPNVQPRDIYALVVGAIGNNFGDVGAGLMQQSTQDALLAISLQRIDNATARDAITREIDALEQKD